MMPQHTACVALASTSLVWSGNTIAGRALADAIPPAAFSFWRWTLILVLLACRARCDAARRAARLASVAGFAFILAGIAVSNGALGALSKALRPG